MAFGSFVRMPAQAVVSPAIGFIGRQSYSHPSALCCTVNRNSVSRRASRKSAPSAVRSKSKRMSPEESLFRVIESEIKFLEESEDYEIENSSSSEQIPNNFPFKLEDNPGQRMIVLTREYKSETITVEVSTPDEDEDDDAEVDEDDDEEDDDDDMEDDDEEDDDDTTDDYYESGISLVVGVSKSSRPLLLKFSCTAYPNEIEIDNLSIMDPTNLQQDAIAAYDGPKFGELSPDFQDALKKYLEVRGFNNRTASFLHDYMTNKGRTEYKLWLKKLNKFIQDEN